MVKVKKVIYAYGACPYQMEALTECGRRIYLRYRGGYLRWGFLDDTNRLTPDKYEFSESIGHHLDGCSDDSSFKKALINSLELPEGFNFEQDIHEN